MVLAAPSFASAFPALPLLGFTLECGPLSMT